LATPGWILTGHTPTYADTYALDNTGATLEQGEPTEGGILTRSIWSQFSPTQNMRVVIHTFGSEIDTVLAVTRARPSTRSHGSSATTIFRPPA
jgi:hypothetical protein